MNNENIYIRRINQDHSSLKISLPARLKQFGFKYKDFLKLELDEETQTVLISKLDLEAELN